MAKAINWPGRYREYWLQAPADERVYYALRLGSLYFENQYWVPDEVVDLRAEHKILRPAVVADAVHQQPLKEFGETLLNGLPPDIQTPEAIAAFLTETYQQPVTPETLVTWVAYRLQPVDWEKVEN